MIKPSLWPRSLRLQMILFILGTVILVQLGSFTVGNYIKERFLEDIVVNYLSTTIRTLRSAVSQIPENRRADFIIEASQKRWYLLSRADPMPIGVAAVAHSKTLLPLPPTCARSRP